MKEILLKNFFMGIASNAFVSKRFGGLGARKGEMKSAVRRARWFSPCLAPLKVQRWERPAPCPGEVWGVGRHLWSAARGRKGTGCVSAWLLPKVVDYSVRSPFAGGCFVLI